MSVREKPKRGNSRCSIVPPVRRVASMRPNSWTSSMPYQQVMAASGTKIIRRKRRRMKLIRCCYRKVRQPESWATRLGDVHPIGAGAEIDFYRHFELHGVFHLRADKFAPLFGLVGGDFKDEFVVDLDKHSYLGTLAREALVDVHHG